MQCSTGGGMITLPGPHWLAAGVTDMRKGFRLAALVQGSLAENPFSVTFVFRGRAGDR